MVRALLGGSFQNTAFTVYAPDGKKQLTESGRSPSMVFGRRGSRGETSTVVREMDTLAKRYKQKGDVKDAVLPDFHSLKQSLNVAAADQKLLIYSVAPVSQRNALYSKLQSTANDTSTQGVFHFDQASKGDTDWALKVDNATKQEGVFVIKAGKFGQKGTVLAELPITASAAEIKAAAIAANTSFAKTETRKNYGEHMKEGRKQGIDFVNGMPHGEDRDGDGKIDSRTERRSSRKAGKEGRH